LTNLDINLVSTQHNGNILADTFKVTVPIRYVLVSDAGSDVEHDNAALALDVISIAETTKLFLSSCIPNIEADRAEICGESEWMDFDTKSGCANSVSTRTGQPQSTAIVGCKTYRCISSQIHP